MIFSKLRSLPTLLVLFITYIACDDSKSGRSIIPVLSPSQRDSLVAYYLKSRPEAYTMQMTLWQKYLDSALMVDPTNAYLWQQKAMPYFKVRKYELGMKYLKKAVELDESRYLPYQAFIKCIFIKDYSEAIKDFENLIKTDPDGTVQDHTYEFYLALSCLQLNYFEKAKVHLKNSIEIQKNEFEDESWIHYLDFFYLGIAEYELEKYESAISYFNESLERYPKFSEAYLYKGWSFYYENERDSANFNLSKASNLKKKGYSISEQNSLYEKYPYQSFTN